MDTLLLRQKEVADLLTIDECMIAVEKAFEAYGRGLAQPPGVLGLHAVNGGFHIKAGILNTGYNYFVAKINANFPANKIQFGLPTIQGIIIVCDALDGRLLAVMDSIEITIKRTGAATGVATKWLASPKSAVATICGCGNQGMISLQALVRVRPIKKLFVFDSDENQMKKFVKEFSNELEIVPVHLNDLAVAFGQSQVIISCTPSRKPYIQTSHIKPGTFIAAVGADSDDKQELFSDLTASAKLVVDVKMQSEKIGELHHAIKDGLMTSDGVHAELGEIVAGAKRGRQADEEIIIFDSTGMALQDVAAAAIVYEKAIANNIGQKIDFSAVSQ